MKKLTKEALQTIRSRKEDLTKYHNILVAQADRTALLHHIDALEGELAARCPSDCLSHPSSFYETELNKLRAECERLRRSI